MQSMSEVDINTSGYEMVCTVIYAYMYEVNSEHFYNPYNFEHYVGSFGFCFACDPEPVNHVPVLQGQYILGNRMLAKAALITDMNSHRFGRPIFF